MLIDMIELPCRYMASDDHLETILPHFVSDEIDNIDWFGRKVPIDLFADDKIRKYKTIEYEGDMTIERIFLIEDEIDMRKSFWTSHNNVYPVQAKFFSMKDPMIGKTIKYVQGIKEVNDKFFNIQLIPSALRTQTCVTNPVSWNMYNSIVPSLDTSTIDGSQLPIYPEIPQIDAWIERNNTLSSIAKRIDSRFGCHQALSVMDHENLFDISEEICNTNPINCSWSMYQLISRLNDLAVSDIRIEVNGYTNEINVAFSSRYSGLFDYSHISGYEKLCTELIHMTQDMLRDRFKEVAWTRVVIEKTWEEELFMTVNVQCPGRSGSIETCYYVDLVVFSLGTVGLV